MRSTADISALLACLYSAPLEEANWQRALEHICQLTETAKSFLIFSDATGSTALNSGGDTVDPESVRMYNEHYGLIDSFRKPFLQKRRTTAVQGAELLSERELGGSKFHDDFLLRFDQRFLTVLPCSVTSRHLEIVTLWNGRRGGEMSSDSIGLLNSLIPHFQTALRLRRALGGAAARAVAAEAALDRMQSGHVCSIVRARSCMRTGLPKVSSNAMTA